VWFTKGNFHFQLPFIGNRAESVERFLTKSLTALQVAYVDLYLIHFPVGFQDKGDGTLWPTDESGAFLIDPSTDHIRVWKVSKYVKHMFLFLCSGSLCQGLMPMYVEAFVTFLCAGWVIGHCTPTQYAPKINLIFYTTAVTVSSYCSQMKLTW
jgi:hypothetical protein